MTTTVTARNAVAVADKLNADFAAGRVATVNGREVVSVWNQPAARAWQNGTVSVTVRGRAKGKTGTVYAKVGQALHTA